MRGRNRATPVPVGNDNFCTDQVAALIDASGLDRSAFAKRIGTSASRLSTYASGKVTPSAAMLLRMQHLAERCR